MTKKLMVYAALPILGLGLVGSVNATSAHGLFGFMGQNATPEEIATRQQDMFQSQAELLGISVDSVKNAWAEGKTLKELADENGISEEQLREKMKNAAQSRLKSNLDSLVSQGVITQAQADKRLEIMQSRIQEGGMRRGGRGFQHMRMGM